MDLTKIIIKSLRANQAIGFLKSLKQLPDDLVTGNYAGVNAFQIANNIHLDFLFDKKEEMDMAKFNVPSESNMGKIEKYLAEFNYKETRYRLELELEPDGP
ncbi:MAG: hypothetical protein AABY15_08200 [Nanoarchaeota archaeon]|mgnify:CR=1 FL=1